MSVDVTVGRVETGGDLVLTLSDSWHIAIQGMSRSGKSVLTYALLAGVAGRNDVLVCGLDPTGILLNPWRQYPGAEFRHLGARDAAEAAATMGRIVEEMDRRIEWLLEHDLDQIAEPTPEHPLLLVIMEEYPATLSAAESDDEAEARKPAERTAPKIKRAVKRLVQEGAKVGVRLVIIAQRMDASIVGGAERSNVGARITLRVDNGDAVTMLHPMASPEVVEQIASFSKGRGMFELPGIPLTEFQSDLLDYPGYVNLVRSACPIAAA